MSIITNMSAKKELKRTAQRTQWTPDLEGVLLDIWEEKIEDLRGARKNSHVYQEMAGKLEEAGFQGNWCDVRTKLDNLTRKYKEERKKIGPTGGAPSKWEHYYKVNAILGSYKTVRAYDDMHESVDMSTLLDDSVIEIDVASCSRPVEDDAECPPRKKKKADNSQELLQLSRERLEMQKERGEQIKHLVSSLDSIAAQNAAFQNELLNILRGREEH